MPQQYDLVVVGTSFASSFFLLRYLEQGPKDARILVLGLAYKPDIDDPRESPAFEIIELLLDRGAEVSYHDPHIPVAPSMRSWPELPPMRSVELTAELLADVDAAVIVTNHRAVDYDLVLEHAPLILDTRGVLNMYLIACGLTDERVLQID